MWSKAATLAAVSEARPSTGEDHGREGARGAVRPAPTDAPARRAARRVLWALASSLLIGGWGSGCGGDSASRDTAQEATSPYQACANPDEAQADRPAQDRALCDAWRRGREEGRVAALSRVQETLERTTADGYRLRRWAALSIVGAGFGLLGALSAAWLLGWRARRRGAGLAAQIAAHVAAEADAIRAAAASDTSAPQEPLVRALVERIREPLAELERQAAGLARRCAPLERRAQGATDRAHLDALLKKLEALASQVERAHLQVTLWRERVLDLDDPARVEERLTRAAHDLEEALREAQA